MSSSSSSLSSLGASLAGAAAAAAGAAAAGADLQHVEKSGFGHTHTISGLDQVNILDDFNSSLSNLGWDSQSLEEAGFLRSHSSVLGRHYYVHWGESSCLGWSLHLIGQQQVSYVKQIQLCEDKSNILLDVRKKTLQILVNLQMSSNGFPHHGVLTHHDNSLSTKGNPNLLHLLRADIVSSNDEALWVLIEQCSKLCEVGCLPGCLVLPNHLSS